MRYPIDPGQSGERVHLYTRPDTASPKKRRLFTGEEVEVEDLDAQEAADPALAAEWLQVTYVAGIGLVEDGWVQRKFVDLGTVVTPPPEEFDAHTVGVFVANCAQAELLTRDLAATATEDDRPRVILADYLIALAMLESNLKNVTTQRAGTDALGPFQITSEEWALFLADPAGAGYNADDRRGIMAQVPCAEFLTQRDWSALETEATAGLSVADSEIDKEFVPSFLTLFHARLLGPKAALALDAVNKDASAKQNDLIEELRKVLPNDEVDALLESRKAFLVHSPPFSVNGFVNNTSSRLSRRLAEAFGLFEEHFPPFFQLPQNVVAPWLEAAEAEQDQWTPKGSWKETNTGGKDRVVNHYFPAANYPTTTVEPWCGAFVAWCMKNCGSAEAAESVVAGPAKASNWKTWGTREIRPGSIKKLTESKPDLIKGAVVVLNPVENSGRSGHVTFALKRASGSEKVECLGGNQSDTVRVDGYEISRIATVRVLELTPEPEEVALGALGGDDPFKDFYASRGLAYTRVVDHSYYNSPISGTDRGNSRIHGDAKISVQKKSIDALRAAAAGLTTEETAMVLAIAKHESGFNPDAAAGTTSAHGLGQFINTTGLAYGLDDQNRWNVAEQARALVAHTRDNYQAVRAASKDDSWVYAKHHDGNLKGENTGHTTSVNNVMPLYLEALEILQGL